MRAGRRSNLNKNVHMDGTCNLKPLSSHSSRALGEWCELLARLNHDLRTPLNAVIGFSDAMQNELFGPLGDVRYQEYAGYIRTSGDQLLRAAEAALAMTALLAEPPAAQRVTVQLAPLIDSLLSDARGVASEVGVRLSGLATPIEVLADPRVLPKALRQLLSLALSHAASGAEIGIEAKPNQHQIVLEIAVSGSVTGVRATEGAAPIEEQAGLGREALSLWLARTLLELNDSPLVIEWFGAGLVLSTSLERPMQPDFFGDSRGA